MKIYDCDDLKGKKVVDYICNSKTPEDDEIVPILETDKKVGMQDLLMINGTAYYACCMGGVRKNKQYAYALVRKLKDQSVFVSNKEPEDQDYTDEIICPYCGAEIESFELPDSKEEYKCEFCKSIFSYERIVTIKYCSQPVKKTIPVVLE